MTDEARQSLLAFDYVSSSTHFDTGRDIVSFMRKRLHVDFP
jgi:hypothetical protein